MNSWQRDFPEAYGQLLGELFILPGSARYGAWYSDTSLSTTWETISCASGVTFPEEGINGVFFYFMAETRSDLSVSEYDKALVWMRAYGETVADYEKMAMFYIAGNMVYYRIRQGGLYPLESDSIGRIQYRAHDNAYWRPNTIYWNVRGFFK